MDTGHIEQFYPSLGVNPDTLAKVITASLLAVIAGVLIFVFVPEKNYSQGKRQNITELTLTVEEKNNPQEKDLSSQAYAYILNDKQIAKSYNDALMYFQSHRDNAAQVEINRILISNASLSIKQKAQVLMSYLEIPTFDTLSDSPEYSDVQKEPALYMDCWAAWGGKITNAVLNNDGSYTCQLLVGYESGKVVDGIVTVNFRVTPNIAFDQPVRILGKISSEDNRVYLEGRAVYQSIKDGMK